MQQRAVQLLVVEDSYAYLQLIREAFGSRNGDYRWEITVAGDGDEALSVIHGDGKTKGFVPDLILLDWNLPKVSGNEVLREVKNHQELRKIPVLVFSSSTAERDIHEAYGLHANGYITKPNDMDLLYKVAEAIEVFWIAIAQLTSSRPSRMSPSVHTA